jgi:hypothetical protein
MAINERNVFLFFNFSNLGAKYLEYIELPDNSANRKGIQKVM